MRVCTDVFGAGSGRRMNGSRIVIGCDQSAGFWRCEGGISNRSSLNGRVGLAEADARKLAVRVMRRNFREGWLLRHRGG